MFSKTSLLVCAIFEGSRRSLRPRNLLLLATIAVGALTLLYFSRPVAAVNRTWDGGGATNNWSEAANWSGDTIPGAGDVAVFDGTNTKDATIDVAFAGSVAGIQINSGYTGTITHASGATLTVGSSDFIQSAGSFTGGLNNIDINHSFTLNGGTFNAPSGLLTFSNNGFDTNVNIAAAATFNPNGGTLAFVGSRSTELTAPASLTLNNITVNKNGNTLFITSSSTLVVTGTLTLTDGAIGGVGTINAQGAVSIASTFDGGNATVLISGAATRTVTLPVGAVIPPLTINAPNVTLNTSGAPGTITFTQPLDLQSAASFTNGAVNFVFNNPFTLAAVNFTPGSGDLTFNSNYTQTGSTFGVGSGALNFNSNFTLSAGTFEAPSGILTFSNNVFSTDINIATAATFNPNGGTVAFTGSSPTNLFLPASLTFFLNNITVNKTNDVSVILIRPGTLVATGTLTLTDGLITVNNGATIDAKGAVSIASTFDGGNAALTFAGSANQTFTNSGGVNPSGTWTINKSAGSLILASDLTLQSGQQLNITSGIFSQGASFNLTAGPILIGAAGRLSNQGSGDLTLAGNISNDGTLSLNGGGGSCGDPDSILIRSLPDGTRRTWSGTGNFFLTDVDVKDQAAANPPVITVFNGTDQPPGGPSSNSNFNFVSGCNPTASGGVVTGRIVDSNGNPVAGAVVRLQGTQNRKFITDANGFYRFENVGTNGFYTVTPSRANYTFSPSVKSFSQIGETTEAAFGATMVAGGFVNPLDTPEYFVRQHYLDFLGREPDEAGFNFWSDQILECGIDTNCIERRRENVSAAYFLSIEFQQTGGLVDGLYRASFGTEPQFAQFMPDTRAVARDVVVGRAGWEDLIETNKQVFVEAFVNRAVFHAAYDGLSSSDFVDALISHTGVSFTSGERDAWVGSLTTGTATRAEVLRSIAENQRFVEARFNEAFVMMEYFGYLRRDPDEAGFAFWLNKLNEFNGNFERAEMVKAFIVAGEYRQRFGQ